MKLSRAASAGPGLQLPSCTIQTRAIIVIICHFFNINLFTLTQIALFFSPNGHTVSSGQLTGWHLPLYTVNWLKGGETKRRKEETSNLILPPLYYGMHRFQTLLRKRQQTLCLRSFLNDAVTACDPEKKKKRKKKQTKIQKSSVLLWEEKSASHRRETKPWSGGGGGCGRSCWPAGGEHEHTSQTQLRRRLPTIFGSLFCKCGSHSAVDNTELYRFFIVFFFIFSPSMLWALRNAGGRRRREDDGELDTPTRGLFTPECVFFVFPSSSFRKPTPRQNVPRERERKLASELTSSEQKTHFQKSKLRFCFARKSTHVSLVPRSKR